jgi:hypothetical protein
MRFNELRETLQLRLSGEFKRFADEELRAVLTLLAGPGVVWELAFGSWVLLQPERINAYAQSVMRTLQAGRASARLPDGGAGLEGRPGISILDAAARRRRGTVRPAGHAPEAGGARSLPAAACCPTAPTSFQRHSSRWRPEVQPEAAKPAPTKFHRCATEFHGAASRRVIPHQPDLQAVRTPLRRSGTVAILGPPCPLDMRRHAFAVPPLSDLGLRICFGLWISSFGLHPAP